MVSIAAAGRSTVMGAVALSVLWLGTSVEVDASSPNRAPQGVQSNASYAASNSQVPNTFATTQRTSCYRPEVPAMQYNFGPASGYSGETRCTAEMATTGEDIGLTPYRTQRSSNPGYPDAGPMLVKDHSESMLVADPAHHGHLIGTSKWEVSPEAGLLLGGFYESYDSGRTWPFQGHIPGYEGWNTVTDPVGAFDTYGNYYQLGYPFQYTYNADGSRLYSSGHNKQPNPGVPHDMIALAEHPYQPASRRTARDWSATNGADPATGPLDILRTYDSGNLRFPDKQWLVIDTRPGSPYLNRIYAVWDEVNGSSVNTVVSHADARPDGTHTAWSTPRPLPLKSAFTGITLWGLPLIRVAGDGSVYALVSGFEHDHAKLGVIRSKDGGQSWSYISTVVDDIVLAPDQLANTTFPDGIFFSFAVGNDLNGNGPLYVTWEDSAGGTANVMLSMSTDGGQHWSNPIQVNDNATSADEFQPTVAVQPDAPGTVSVTFYDRRLPCPGTTAAADVPGTESYNAGLRLDTVNPRSPVGPNPPYGVANYCVDSSVQFYRADLTLFADHPHNIRLTKHSWDPQLNAHRSSANPDEPLSFIGDYYGSVIADGINYFSFVSTFDDTAKSTAERNPSYQQQQVVAVASVPTS